MAYIGNKGIVKFQRSAPEPVVVPAAAVIKASNYVTVNYDDWLLAEQVTLVHLGGTLQGYVFRDELDRIYLHSTRAGALANTVGTRLSFSAVDVTKPVILAANANSNQIQVLSTLVASLTAATSETPLRAWPASASSYKAAATANPLTVQGDLRRWEFSRSAPEVDTSALGDRFGTAIKSVITGSGSFDFLVNFYWDNTEADVDRLLRAVQLTDEGSVATTRFYLKQTTAAAQCADSSRTLVTSALYFKSSILITASSINVSAEDLIAGSANFVTTGPIRLLSE